jgi:hypothetical protein
MTDLNPFGDIDREFAETLAKHLSMAEALDGMEGDVNTWEAGFLQSVLDQLRIDKRPLTQNQVEKLNEMCTQYDIDTEDL